jgi:hypothetical protein
VSFHPADGKILILTGKGILKQYAIHEESLSPSEFEYAGTPRKLTDYHFTDHYFTEENQLLVCTESGELFAFHLFNLLQSIKSPDVHRFTCLTSYRGNNFCVGTEEGNVLFYKYEGDRKTFELVRVWNQCLEIKYSKIIGICSKEVSKEDIQVAIIAKS